MKFSAILKEARKKKGISLEKLGKKVYRSHQQLSKIERGIGGCDFDLAVDILKALGLSIKIYDFEGEEENTEMKFYRNISNTEEEADIIKEHLESFSKLRLEDYESFSKLRLEDYYEEIYEDSYLWKIDKLPKAIDKAINEAEKNGFTVVKGEAFKAYYYDSFHYKYTVEPIISFYRGNKSVSIGLAGENNMIHFDLNRFFEDVKKANPYESERINKIFLFYLTGHFYTVRKAFNEFLAGKGDISLVIEAMPILSLYEDAKKTVIDILKKNSYKQSMISCEESFDLFYYEYLSYLNLDDVMNSKTQIFTFTVNDGNTSYTVPNELFYNEGLYMPEAINFACNLID